MMMMMMMMMMLRGEKDKTINHISVCRNLSQNEHKTRHDWAGRLMHC